MLAINKPIIFNEHMPLNVSICCISHQETHYHENAVELILVLKGTVHMRSSHRHVTLHKGDTFSMDPGDIHCIYSDMDNIVLHVHINVINDIYTKDRMYNCFFACETQHIQIQQIAAGYKASDLMLAAALEYAINKSSASISIITNICNNLLETLVKHFDWLSFMWDPTDSNPMLQERFHRIISYCQSNYKEKISISMLAEKEHFNENYFSTLMKKTSFDGFNYMLNFFRCDGAERLLLTTNQSVIEISSTCGFSDPKYFYKHFKKWWNMSPAKLRQWFKEYSLTETFIEELSYEDALPILKEYLANYHIERSLRL